MRPDDVTAQCVDHPLRPNVVSVEMGRIVMWNSDANYRFVLERQQSMRQAAEQARLAKRGQRRRWWKRSNPPQSR
jgi:hypothetical protein